MDQYQDAQLLLFCFVFFIFRAGFQLLMRMTEVDGRKAGWLQVQLGKYL